MTQVSATLSAAIHPSAIIADDIIVNDEMTMGPFAVIGLDQESLAAPVFTGKAICRSHSVIYRGSTFGPGLHISHGGLVREECTFGKDVSVGSHSIVEHHVTLGDGVRLHSRCFVPEFSVLEDGVWLGPGVTVTNSKYPNQEDSKDRLDGVHLRRGATVGAAAVLLPGVEIGENAMIGAGSVITKDVPAGAVVVGNPGRKL